ncbi:MAG TPA: type I methionyl aminopeptidase [Candidatus Levybacteria bacterium]|nr:type I methionyl aminopeptidase [Candidatus Levybacteria bacterium]
MANELEQKIEAMSRAGVILGGALDEVLTHAKPGVTELELNDIVDKYITKNGGYPGFKKVPGYKHAICACTNEVVVHGIPKKRVLKKGDIICIDTGVFVDGYHTDMGETIKIGEKIVDTVSDTDKVGIFLSVGKQTMWKAIEQAIPGNRVGHISQVIQEAVEGAGYSVVKNLVGHGVGKTLHEKPEIPGILMGSIEKTPIIKDGMTLAIEVIYNMGGPSVEYDGTDGWTIVTSDGSLSAVFERTILVSENGPILLTKLHSDELTRRLAL